VNAVQTAFNENSIFFYFNLIFFMFSYFFDVLMSKFFLKNKKNYFNVFLD